MIERTHESDKLLLSSGEVYTLFAQQSCETLRKRFDKWKKAIVGGKLANGFRLIIGSGQEIVNNVPIKQFYLLWYDPDDTAPAVSCEL